MKKFLSTLIAFTALLQAPSANAGCFDSCDPCCDSFFESPALEFKFAALYPFESIIRDVYNDFLPSIELEASFMCGCNIKPWLNASYIWNEGHSIGEHDKTEIKIIPFALGIDYVFNSCLCGTDFYIGAGGTYSLLRIHDHSPYVHQHTDKGAWGGIARTGFIYHYNDCLFLDGFLEYFYTRYSFKNSNIDDPLYVERNDLNLSSLKFGVGIGYNF